MKLEEITAILNDYVTEHFEIGDDPDYSPDANLFDYGFVDSLGAVEIIMFIEERFGCVISQRDISKYPMNTVREIAEVVEEKLRS
jgi:D-alanine--poly(phosphoribitol) ligase subunit 2